MKDDVPVLSGKGTVERPVVTDADKDAVERFAVFCAENGLLGHITFNQHCSKAFDYKTRVGYGAKAFRHDGTAWSKSFGKEWSHGRSGAASIAQVVDAIIERFEKDMEDEDDGA